MKYHILLVTVLLCFITFENCQKVCNFQGRVIKKCCVNYKYVNGSCIECPKGSFGEECGLPCPDGYYGVVCRGKCNCTSDQICDVQEGCVQDNSEKTFGMIDSTSTEQQTRKSPEYNGGLHWYYLFGVPLGVVIMLMVLLTIHTHRKWKTSDQESESRLDQQTQDRGSQALQINQSIVQSDYDEIFEFDTECSHIHTFSSDFNEISVSRSTGKEVNQVQ